MVELAVVVACVAVLAFALLPALARTTNRSHQAVDLSNYEILLAGVNLYVNDHRGLLPAPGWGLGNTCWAADSHYGDLTGNTSAAGISNQLSSMTRGEIYPYVNSPKVYFCPLDRTNTPTLYNDWRGRAVKTTSYIMNGSVCEFGRLPLGGPIGISISQSDIARSDAILFWETDERIPFYFNDFSAFPYEGLTRRHVIGGAVGNHTGSAEFISFKQYNDWSPTSGKLPNRFWWSPDTVTGR